VAGRSDSFRKGRPIFQESLLGFDQMGENDCSQKSKCSVSSVLVGQTVLLETMFSKWDVFIFLFSPERRSRKMIEQEDS
jgi:hypothetical protein